MLDGNNDGSHGEISAFAALVQSSSGEAGDENASLVSLDDERLGIDETYHDEDSTDASTSVEDVGDGDVIYDDLYGQEGGHCHFLLARIKTNPSLSIATLIMGMLTAYLWTDERFRFIMRRDQDEQYKDNYDGFIHEKKGKKKIVVPKSFPAFPAKALLGITVHKKSSTLVYVKGAPVCVLWWLGW